MRRGQRRGEYIKGEGEGKGEKGREERSGREGREEEMKEVKWAVRPWLFIHGRDSHEEMVFIHVVTPYCYPGPSQSLEIQSSWVSYMATGFFHG